MNGEAGGDEQEVNEESSESGERDAEGGGRDCDGQDSSEGRMVDCDSGAGDEDATFFAGQARLAAGPDETPSSSSQSQHAVAYGGARPKTGGRGGLRVRVRGAGPGRAEEEGGEGAGEEDCWVYTYRGGTAYLSADLPNSFFRLDSGSDGESLPGVAGAGQSNLSTGVAALIQDQLINSPQLRSFSPEQDFIEMDFDPGFESDGASSGDSGRGRDGGSELDAGTRAVSEEEIEVEEVESGGSSPDPGPPQLPALLEPVLVQATNNNQAVGGKEECRTCGPELGGVTVGGVALQTCSAPGLSPAEEVPVLIPRSKSLNSALGCLASGVSPPARPANISLCGSRLLQREALLFREEGGADSDLATQLYLLSFSDCLSLTQQKAMIWTEKEAIRKQVNQVSGSSSCGATALLNVLLALEVETDLEVAAAAVRTRARRPDSALPDYLVSRSEAGCTHQDLLDAVASHLPDLRAKFLPLLPGRCPPLAHWLAGCIARGLVPVLTLNVQRARPEADAWHHQMVWGVSGSEVYLANPLEVVSEEVLVPQLAAPSELLVRRADVLSRCHPNLDLAVLTRLGPRWRRLNVLGQVVNAMREEAAVLRGEDAVTLSPHVTIPASYTSGVTLFCLQSNAEATRFLLESPDLLSVKK